MTDTIYAWSQTAGSNGDADATINFAEYQFPETVNDSARALMARVAELISDLAPTRSSTGSSNAYAVTTAAAGASLRNGEQITFTPNHTNTAACTLNVDGRGAKPWRPKQGTEFSASNIQSGVPVTAYYYQPDDCWYSSAGYYVTAMASGVALQSITARLPQIGDMVISFSPTPGAGRIRLTETTSSHLKSSYPELNSYLSGISYPWGSSSTHFNLPPAAGYFLRFAATSSSIDTGGARTAGSTQTDGVKSHTHSVSASGTTSTAADHVHTYSTPSGSILYSAGGSGSAVQTSASTTTGAAGAHNHSVTVTGTASAASDATSETRAKNVAFHVDVVASTALSASQVAVFGFPYQWDTGTTAGNPGAGRVRGNNATLASITALYVSTTDGWGVNITAILTDLSSGNVIHLSRVGAQANRLVATVNGTPTAATGYVSIPVTMTVSAGTLSSNDQLALEYSRGSAGLTGATGPSSALPYNWNLSTSGDPGSGKILANNGTLSSATAIHISKTGKHGQSFGGYLATWDDSSSVIKGHVSIYTLADRTEYIEADVTGIADNSTYYTVNVTNVVAAGSPNADDEMAVGFFAKGDQGDGANSFTAAGLALMDDADAAAQRTTLGLGTAATSASTDFQSANFTQDGTGAVARTTLSKLKEWVSVKDFGATGDGVTDDTAEIQAAATAASGGVLYFPPGTYLLSASTAHAAIQLPAAGLRLLGADRHKSILKMANTTAAAMLAGIDCDEVEIDGIGFDGSSTARLAWQRSCVLRGCRKVRVRNNWFYRIGDGGILFGTTGFGGSDAYGEGTRQTERVAFTDNLIEDCWGTVSVLMKYIGAKDVIISRNIIKNSCTVGVSVESEQSTAEYADRVVVTENIVENIDYLHSSGASTVSYGIAIGERAREIICANNIVNGVAGGSLAAGILVSTSPTQDDTEAFNVVVNSNSIRTVTGATGRGFGVLLQAGDTSIGRISVTGNAIDSAEDGIAFDVDSGAKTAGRVDYVTISANVIANCTEFGIQSLTVSSSGSLPSRGVAITGNAIIDAANHGMTLFLTDSTISGNVVRSCGGSGVFLASGSERLSVVGNSVFENSSDGIVGSVSNSAFIGNVSMNNGQGGGTTYGLRITGGGTNLVSGNRLCDSQGSPTQSYGFRGQTSDRLINNDLLGNALGAVFGGISGINQGVIDAYGNRTATASALSTTQSATIATGAVTINSGVRIATIDTEASAASDDLDTITYAGVAGDFLRVRAANSSRTVVVKDGTGNMRLEGDMSLDNVEDSIVLQFNGTNWDEISRSNNGA